ncbi:MAG: Lrp/AsnC ligand binding domain-containing protein [Nitrososphaerota archaeon]|nr:Lrp/AsnC ligand binding domain-containing protein [Nitrososphaerota archaeon]
MRIVEILQGDGRAMYKDIAQKVGVSLPTVRTRVRHLMELGVIRKFTVIVDPDKIFGKVRGLVLLQLDPTSIEEAVSKLNSMKEVRETYMTTGAHSLVLKVETRDLDELGQLVSKKLSEVKGITGYSTLVITKTTKEEYGATVDSYMMVQFKCEFCHTPIVGKPYVEYIDGGRYYFNSERCAKAYKHMKVHKEEEISEKPQTHEFP